MGRWMQKVQKSQQVEPTKPTKPSSVGSVGTPSPLFQKKQSVNDPLSTQQRNWREAVASLLDVGPLYLVEKGLIDHHNLEEQLNAEPQQVAALISSNSSWGRPQTIAPKPKSRNICASTNVTEALNGNEP